MLHPVAICIGKVVGDESVSTILELRELTKYLYFLGDNLLDFLEVNIDIFLGAIMMNGESYRRGLDLPTSFREVAELDGAIHEILQIGRCKNKGVVRR